MIDTSDLPFPKVTKQPREANPARLQNRDHLAFVATQKCCACGRWPVEVHHLLRSPVPKARGAKPSSEWTVPLCPTHHRGKDSPHGVGNETAWAASHRLDLIALAQWYWARSPANKEKGPMDADEPVR